jgi:hypothetical protein
VVRVGRPPHLRLSGLLIFSAGLLIFSAPDLHPVALPRSCGKVDAC